MKVHEQEQVRLAFRSGVVQWSGCILVLQCMWSGARRSSEQQSGAAQNSANRKQQQDWSGAVPHASAMLAC